MATSNEVKIGTGAQRVEDTYIFEVLNVTNRFGCYFATVVFPMLLMQKIGIERAI
jgi:hypothetical protein